MQAVEFKILDTSQYKDVVVHPNDYRALFPNKGTCKQEFTAERDRFKFCRESRLEPRNPTMLKERME